MRNIVSILLWCFEKRISINQGADDLIVAALFEFLRSESQSGVGFGHVGATWQLTPKGLLIVPRSILHFTSTLFKNGTQLSFPQ